MDRLVKEKFSLIMYEMRIVSCPTKMLNKVNPTTTKSWQNLHQWGVELGNTSLSIILTT